MRRVMKAVRGKSEDLKKAEDMKWREQQGDS
jgi:hypothetical protein